MIMIQPCYYCEEYLDCRPYGPDGAWVCISCAKADPNRDRKCGARFRALLKQAGEADAVGLAALTSTGPVPYDTVSDDQDDVEAVLDTRRLNL